LKVEMTWVIDRSCRRSASQCRRDGPASDTLAILYTSGTTGHRRACAARTRSSSGGASTLPICSAVRDDDVLCTPLPLFHTNALNTFFQALITGASAIFESRVLGFGFLPDARGAPGDGDLLARSMVPILLSRPPSDGGKRASACVSRWRPACPATSMPNSPGARNRIARRYGSTETNFVIGTEIGEARPGTMGRIFEGFHARVVDEEDNEVPDGTPGERCCAPKHLLPLPPATSARPRRRSRPGAISGSIPATG